MNRWYLLLSFACVVWFGTGCTNEPSPTEKPTSSVEEPPPSPQETKMNRILFFGNSLTAGYGIDPQVGYVALIQAKLDSLGLPYQAINAGLSGETSAGGRDRVDWILQESVSVFVLELGGNDGLRGIEPESTYDNLKAILESVQNKYPEAHLVLTGMEAPPNMGSTFTEAFRAVFPRLEEEFELTRIPFLLEGVAGETDLNQTDGIHPNEAGQILLAETVWQYLQPLLSPSKKATSNEVQ